jgi:SAM-dependent methyltransferase
MIARAREKFGETNNRFIHDNVLDPKNLGQDYDAVICVRVLINLRSLDEQRRAVRNLVKLVRPGGILILVEGFTEGFKALTALREQVNLPPVEPAKINFYSSVNDLMPDLTAECEVEDQFHLGAYDYLTRVMYPLVVGAENAKHNSVFSERCQELARAFNPDCFAELSRVRGLVMRKRK